MVNGNHLLINTGNVLNLVDFKKKAGQNVLEELTESLQITINEWKKTNNNSISKNDAKDSVNIYRSLDDTQSKMSEEERKDLKIGIKIFVQDSSVSLEDCLETIYNTLGIKMIDNVVLAYNPNVAEEQSTPLINGDATDTNDDSQQKSDVEKTKCDKLLPDLEKLWKVLEGYVKDGRILQIGVSDLEENCFKRLYATSNVKPSIIQINLASCCVVPPGLQAFCKDNDIQLLTHSDPQEIITKDILDNIIGSPVNRMDWCARYQVHIKCRGVLALKGYMLSAIN